MLARSDLHNSGRHALHTLCGHMYKYAHASGERGSAAGSGLLLGLLYVGGASK